MTLYILWYNYSMWIVRNRNTEMFEKYLQSPVTSIQQIQISLHFKKTCYFPLYLILNSFTCSVLLTKVDFLSTVLYQNVFLLSWTENSAKCHKIWSLSITFNQHILWMKFLLNYFFFISRLSLHLSKHFWKAWEVAIAESANIMWKNRSHRSEDILIWEQ